MIELEQTPRLLPLYARAVVTAPRRHGDRLPDTELIVRDQRVDLAHLIAYERLCGFRVQDVLPPTYLHVLSLPLAVWVMVAPGFPLALPGLVHVADVIEQRRAVRANEPVTLRVRATDLRGHRAGTQVDLITEAHVGDETVWRERRTYLRRGKGDRPGGPRAVSEAPPGPTALIRVPGDIGRRYAAISGDRNPIHLHPLAARAFGFPRAIAHGMWVVARVLASVEARLPEAMSIDLAFKTPVLLPSTVSVVAAPDGDGGWRLDARNARSGKPHLAGTVSPR